MFESEKQKERFEFVGQWPDRSKIERTDKFRLHQSHVTNFECDNDFCTFSTPRFNDFNKHVQTCTNVTAIEYRQEKMTIKNLYLYYFILFSFQEETKLTNDSETLTNLVFSK